MATAAITTTITEMPAMSLPYLGESQQGDLSIPQGKSPLTAESALKVLVVEDSPFARKLIEEALFGQPYSLIFATTGRQAVDLYVQHSPSLIIMDWMMPDLNGLEICRRLRSISF